MQIEISKVERKVLVDRRGIGEKGEKIGEERCKRDI
jgi:hypothetical protein